MVPPDVRFQGKNAPNLIPLVLCPRPYRGSLQLYPEPLAVFKGLLLRGGKGKRRKGMGREDKEREGRGGDGEREG